MRTVVILSAVRTPVGRFLGGLASIPAPRLGSIVIAEAVRRTGVQKDQVDEVIMGNVLGAGLGQAPARQATLHGGLPQAVPATTVNKMCGSGLKAVMLAAQAIAVGDADVAVAGGMENMSASPYILPGARTGYRLGDGKIIDTMLHDGLIDAYKQVHMGNCAEMLARGLAQTPDTLLVSDVAGNRPGTAAALAQRRRDQLDFVLTPRGHHDAGSCLGQGARDRGANATAAARDDHAAAHRHHPALRTISSITASSKIAPRCAIVLQPSSMVASPGEPK